MLGMGILLGYEKHLPRKFIFFGINQCLMCFFQKGFNQQYNTYIYILLYIYYYIILVYISIVWILHDFIADCHIELDTASISRSVLVHTSVE